MRTIAHPHPQARRRSARWRGSLCGAVLAALALSGSALAIPIQNTASGTTDAAPLDLTQATVTLDRVGGVVTSALAEIAPNTVMTGEVGRAFAYDVLPTIGAGDSGVQTVRLTVPPGYTNANVTGVTVGGSPLVASCPAPAAGEFCATAGAGSIDFLLGSKVTVDQTRIELRFTCDTPPVAGAQDFVSTLLDGAASAPTVPGDADGDPADANSITVDAAQTQGLVLRLDKSVDKSDALVGDVVTYRVEIRNAQTFDVVAVHVDDLPPPSFKYLRDSTRRNGQPAPDPTGARPLRFSLGTIPAWSDLDGSGTVDPGEPGYVVLSYQLVVGSGAVPGNHDNTAVARDFCASCEISNTDTARVRVTLDPLFDLGTIVGKVFDDRNADGRQDPGERGVEGARVALDEGTYALTDPYGRYHFPAVIPGNRLVKIDLGSLPPGAEATTDRRLVVRVTPGLMARAHFGVRVWQEIERIGAPAESGLALTPAETTTPLAVQGNAETLALLINGVVIPLEGRGVSFRVDAVDDLVRIRGDRVERQPVFDVGGPMLDQVRAWRLRVTTSAGAPVRTLSGTGPPPPGLAWDGRDDDGALLRPGALYRYHLEVDYEDGARSTSAVRLFGVHRTSVVALTLSGSAFATGRHALSAEAQQALSEAAAVLRRFPEETVIIEGHTDSIGSAESNVELSLRRADAARAFLIDRLGLAAERIVLRAHGEERPVATNALPEGRALNRRVEIKGRFTDVERSQVLDVHRARPRAAINGTELETDSRGRFQGKVDDPAVSRLDVALADAQGRSVSAIVAVPTIRIDHPLEPLRVPLQGSVHGCAAGSGGRALTCRIAGRTEPGNELTVDGATVEVGADGSFAFDAALTLGDNTVALLARNGAGLTRIANLRFTVGDRDEEGRALVLNEPVPGLAVTLPPAGVRLRSRTLRLAGSTAPGNTVRINDEPVEVDAQGAFTTAVELPTGTSRLVIEVRDPEGRTGSIEREVHVARHELFLLAFADGKVGQFDAEGAVARSRVDESEDLFVEGRLAFYLKGRIAGKYLLTSALDTGIEELEPLFGDLDAEETDRLLTHIDPERLYPVYGDSSTVVHDAESRGRFYLALDGETIHAVVGNYPLQLDDAELARYQRTLYGARFVHRSASLTRHGRPDTEVVLFAADVEETHVQDELRATGGSLYYLSHRDVIEGSEQVTLVVRDENTGLILERRRQQRDTDYAIKYPEGRLTFHRPLSSVALDDTPSSQNVLAGHPVFLQVDYETRGSVSFDQRTAGGRLRRQLGDRLSLGGTHVQDDRAAGSYELSALDAELRVGEGTRFTAEYAESTGADARVFTSDDGGLTFTELPLGAAQTGSAWKAAAELDVGEWFQRPGRHLVKLYVRELEAGFFANGNVREQGTRKTGALGRFRIGERDSVEVRHEREDRDAAGPASPAGASEATTGSVVWRHARERWKLNVELFSSEIRDAGGTVLRSSDLVAASFETRIGEKLTASVQHQQTLDGTDDDRSSAGVRYQATSALALDVQGSTGDRGSAAQVGALLDVGEGGSVYATERVRDEPGGRRRSTVLGARSPIGDGSEVYTEYQLERSADDPGRAVSLLGIQRQWNPGPRFRIRVAGERADVDAPAGADRRTAVSTSLSFQDPDGLTAQTRNEVRRETGTRERTQLSSYNQLDYRLDPSLTLLVRHRYSKTRDRVLDEAEARLEERSVGVAYRPVTHDRFDLLGKYTRLLDRTPDSRTGVRALDRTTDVVSVDTGYRIHTRIEWLSKIAARAMEERFGDRPAVDTRTTLLLQRANILLRHPLDLGLEYRLLRQREADDGRQGWLAELSWRLHENFRVGVGYNFTDFSDDLLSQNDGSLRGWFLRAQGFY